MNSRTVSTLGTAVAIIAVVAAMRPPKRIEPLELGVPIAPLDR
jgi:hypothetical protein